MHDLYPVLASAIMTLAFFNTLMIETKSFGSFYLPLLPTQKTTNLAVAFDVAKMKINVEGMAAFGTKEVKKSCSAQRQRKSFSRTTVNVKADNQFNPSSFLKLKDGGHAYHKNSKKEE